MSSVSGADGGYNYYQKKLGDLESEMREDAKRTREHYDERAESLERNYKKTVNKHDQDNEDTVNTIRNNSKDAYIRNSETTQDQIDRAKAQTYDKFGRARDEIAYHQKRADEAIQQAVEDSAHAQHKTNEAAEIAIDRANWANQQRLTENEEKENASRLHETRELRKENSALIDAERHYMKEKGQGSADARRDIESEARAREQVLTSQYTGEIKNLKRNADEADYVANRTLDAEKHDDDLQRAALVKRMTGEREDNEKFLQNQFGSALEQEHSLAQREKAASEKAIEKQVDTLHHQQEVSLQKQGEIYRDENQRQRAEDNLRIGKLDDDLHTRMTSPEERYISPAAEAKLRNDFTQEYERKHQAEVHRNKDKVESIQTEYASRLTNTVQDAEARITQAELRRRADEHAQEQSFLAHFGDVENDKELSLRNKDYESLKQAESLNRTYGNSLGRQRREYESMLDQTRTSAKAELTSLRQQMEVDAKMVQRKFAAQQNELIRNYNRKMDDQKNAYEDMLSQLKEQNAQNTSEAERRTQRLLDGQTKGHEQKIATMEFQSKERERTISDNYQDQIEKLKRSNALLSQRKS